MLKIQRISLKSLFVPLYIGATLVKNRTIWVANRIFLLSQTGYSAVHSLESLVTPGAANQALI